MILENVPLATTFVLLLGEKMVKKINLTALRDDSPYPLVSCSITSHPGMYDWSWATFYNFFSQGDTIVHPYHYHGGPNDAHHKWLVECNDGWFFISFGLRRLTDSLFCRRSGVGDSVSILCLCGVMSCL